MPEEPTWASEEEVEEEFHDRTTELPWSLSRCLPSLFHNWDLTGRMTVVWPHSGSHSVKRNNE